MRFSVTYDEGEWFFEVMSTGEEPSHIESFEVDDIEDAIEACEDLLRQLRTDEDPLADLFEGDY
jgi:hypothetical protein